VFEFPLYVTRYVHFAYKVFAPVEPAGILVTFVPNAASEYQPSKVYAVVFDKLVNATG
jgi:hypothetical protein